MIAYESVSQTERTSVHNDALTRRSGLKIQSDLGGNSKD